MVALDPLRQKPCLILVALQQAEALLPSAVSRGDERFFMCYSERVIPRQEVFDTYWYFAAERQRIFYQRLAGAAPPYTTDPILQQGKFCNVYRACDRVSQFLIKEVIYARQYPPLDTVFRIMLFRLLNRPQTWVELEQRLDDISLSKFSLESYAKALEDIRQTQPIYGNAFILCANKAFGFDQKHRNHLALLQQIFTSDEAEKLLNSQSLESLFKQLHSLPLIGTFMAYQLAIDLNYSTVFNFSENDFTAAGPGAIRGIQKCFTDLQGASYEQAIMYMVEHQDQEFARLGLEFKNLGGRQLQAIDCQGLFCETDKYCRLKFPELKSNRHQLKAKFKANPQPINYFFPPKWGISLSV
jgi:hypothetical protein